MKTTLTNPVDDVPLSVVFALSRLHDTQAHREELVRVYGPERGE